MKQPNRQFILLCMFVLGLSIVQSCTKTETIDYEQATKNRILSYVVSNSPEQLMGAIDQEAGTIKVYIPFYSNLDYLISKITLDEGATLLRADSTSINLLEDELDPVLLGDTTTYIVRSADGAYRSYKLVQEVLAAQEALSIMGYGNAERRGAFNFVLHTIEKGDYALNANQVFYTFGNFLSSSRIAKFFLTNEGTGEVHTDYVDAVAVTPQSDNIYVMTARVSPEAKHGIYRVRLEHQGRSTDLPSIKIAYTLSYGTYFSTSAAYAPGDTVVFNAAMNTTYATPERIYLRVDKSSSAGAVPGTFAEDLYGKDIDMKILSSSRTSITAVFPDIPAGFYLNPLYNAINIYSVFLPEEGFSASANLGSEMKIGIPDQTGFTVLPKR